MAGEAENSGSDLGRYITPQGLKCMRDEFSFLMRDERPRIVEIVSWAAGNGDRSENGDYLYGKKRLREIDRRLRFLTKRIENAILVDPAAQTRRERVYFGATVLYVNEADVETEITIVGVDEASFERREISLISPAARALMGRSVGDEIQLVTPRGAETIEILRITYPDAPDIAAPG